MKPWCMACRRLGAGTPWPVPIFLVILPDNLLGRSGKVEPIEIHHLPQAAVKARMNSSPASADAYTSEMARSSELEPKTRSTEVRAARRERDRDVVAGLAGSLLDGRTATQDDHVGRRDLLGTCLGVVEVLPDLLKVLQYHR
jgi:hypothetical protein